MVFVDAVEKAKEVLVAMAYTANRSAFGENCGSAILVLAHLKDIARDDHSIIVIDNTFQVIFDVSCHGPSLVRTQYGRPRWGGCLDVERYFLPSTTPTRYGMDTLYGGMSTKHHNF